MKSDVAPGAQPRVLRFMCTQWAELCRQALESSLGINHVRDVCKGCDGDTEFVVSVHLRFVIAVIRHFCEFGLLYQHFPWKFFLLLSGDRKLTDETLCEMKREWLFLLSLEKSGQCHRQYPCKMVPHLSWFAYREIMTACEEVGWQCTSDLRERVAAWFPEPCSTLGADAAFRHDRLGESKQQRQEISVEQLQAVSCKGLNERYKEFKTPTDLDFNGIKPSQFIKKAVFDSGRACASDTGLVGFNSMIRAATISPHHLTRKCLNIWSAMKATDGCHTHFWTAQLARSGQVPNCLMAHCCGWGWEVVILYIYIEFVFNYICVRWF